jgi:hypothetical protein
MSEKPKSGVPFESDDAGEQQLWRDLEGLPQEAPSQQVRRRFYAELEHADRRLHRRRRWLSLFSAPGLAAAMGCVLVGVMIGVLLRNSSAPEHAELAQLQQQVALLGRNLVLDRLENDSASKRLLGVIEASDLAGRDPEVMRALLDLAVDDRVHSVRTAAIDAIGPRLGTPAVGNELMASLQKAESPLVQLALADMVLRYGSPNQLEQLLQLSEAGKLHPDVAQHVKSSVSRNPV